MKNARNNGQKRVKNCLKWTASGLLLALMFVLVFAGTLSGAFGIENELQQNGIIENNVASAAVAQTNDATVSGTNVRLENHHNGDNGVSFLLSASDFYNQGIFSTPASSTYGWGFSENASTGNKKSFLIELPLSNKIVSALNNDIKVSVRLNARQIGGYNADWGTIGIYSSIPTAYPAIGHYSSWGTNHYYWNWTTLPNNVIAYEKGTGSANEWSTSKDAAASCEGVIPKGTTKVYLAFHTISAGDFYIYYDNITVDFIFESNVSFSTQTGENGSISPTSQTYSVAGTNDDKVVSATPNQGYHFTGWTYNGGTSRVDNLGLAGGEYTFNGSNIINGKTYTANFSINKINVVFHRNLVSGDTQQRTQEYTYNGNDLSLGHWEKTGNKTFVGWAKADSPNDVYHKYGKTAGGTYDCVASQSDIAGKSLVNALDHGSTIHLYAVWVDSDFGVLSGKDKDSTWGLETNPFVISNVQHLKNLSDIVNGSRDPVDSVDGVFYGENINTAASDIKFENCYFVVAADLGTADAQIALVPIGKDITHYFAGTIFGGNDSDANNRTMRTISLNIQSGDENNVGLFGYVKGATATISHLTMEGTIVGGAAVGGLVGYADGVTISNCRNNASVTGAYMIGGLVGFGNNVTITSSVNNADITGEYNKAGTPSGLTKGAYVGGFVGVVNGGSIANCYNNGNISASGDNSDFLGGIAGYTKAPISYCVSLEAKTIKGSNQVGGIVGKASGNNAKIENCYFGGKINGLWNDNGAKLDFICAEKEDGSSVSNSWKLSSAIQGVTGNRQYTNAGHSIQASAFSLSPSYFDGTEYTPYTEVDGWQNILTVNINAFQILGGTESGKFLALHDGSNKSTLPNKTIIDKEKNSTGSIAKTDLVVNFIVYYKADTKQNVVAELKDIKIDAAAVDYNATEQYVVDNTQLPTTVNTHYFKQSFYFDQNGGGNATLGKTNAGTYKVYSDVWIRANNTDYLVGRKESIWTIKKLKFTIDNNQFFYGQDIENAIKNQIVIRNQSNVSVPKGAYTVVFGFNDTEHNFYGSIDIDQKQKEFSVAKTIISIYDSSNTLINDNFDINGFSVIVKAGDFGVQNNGINKSNIENNPWGSERNPYIIGTRDQLVTLSNIVRGVTNATNSWYTSDVYKYVKGTIASYGGAYFKLARSLTSIGNITPIGTSSNVFSATFDGNKKTISGLNISVAGNNVGLFGYISGATIKDLTVNGSVKGSSNVGGVVGYALNSTIENVTNNASVTSRYSSDKDISSNPSDWNKFIVQYDGGNVSGQGFDKLFDNQYGNNKFVGNQNSAMSFVCDFGTSIPNISGFAIYNGNDTLTYSNRRPKIVRIWGSNTGDRPNSNYNGKTNAGNTPEGKSYADQWTKVFDSSDIRLPIDNEGRHEYAFSDGKGYNFKYYWVYMASVGHSAGQNANTNTVIQLADFDFLAAGATAGGVAGYAGGTNIVNTTNKGNIVGGSNVGGVVGYAVNSNIITATNAKQVVGMSNVGGIVGEFNSLGKSVSGATNSGAITSSNTAAGIVGKLTEGSISGSKNTGRVTASVATIIDGETGAFLGGIAGWANGNVNKCYNDGEITTETLWPHSDIVGGIVGYLVNGKTVSYCYNSGTIAGSSQIGGIIGKLPGYRSTVTYCYHSGTINSVWNDANGVAQGELGHITGNNTEVLDSCWILPGASTNTAASTKIKTNGRTLKVGQNKYVPATIADYAEHSWLDILTVEINGFRVQESVDPSQDQFFESKKGLNSSEFLTPIKTENNNQANALNRDNTASFTVTAWYGANTASDIYCAVNTIAINTSADTYNNAQLGFTRSDVTTPGTSGSVYGIVFDYKGKNPNENFVCAFDSNGNIVAGSTNPTQVDTYNTTVFVKIGDIVVGKMIAVDYKIEKATLNVGWTWTDNLHANLYDRTGDGDKVQFVYNGKAQGLGGVSAHLGDENLFYVTGNYWTNTDAATYTRTYTLIDTRNYKLNFTNDNTGLTESATSVEFKWTIRKNKLTVFNRWVAEDFGKDSNLYTFEYNTTHRGLLTTNYAITFFTEKATDNTKPELKQGTDYTISEHQNAISVGEYSRIVTILNNNYEVGDTHACVGSSTTATVDKGINVSENKLVVTYKWKIVPFDLAANISNVWFGGTMKLIVGNQGIANVEGDTTKSYYPLQADKKGTGVQQVLVYAQHNYAVDNFVLYVKYNNGIVAELKQGTDKEYTVGTLDTSNNTVGTFNVNVVSQANPVVDTNVTASGTGNFSGIVTKYYTALFSDFDWKDGKTPEDDDWGGSADNPYVISTPEHLLRLSQIVNGGKAWNSIKNTVTEGLCIAPQGTAVATDRAYRGAYFLVAADIDNIDMTGNVSTDGVYNFLPIGHRNEQSQTDMPFSGTFDGNGKKIKFVYNVNRNNFYNNSKAHSDYVGLFGYIAGYKVDAEQKYATIKNLSIESMDGNEVDDNGGIIGKDYVGGIAGYAVDSKLYNVSMMYGSWVRGENYVGGIVGYADNTWLEVGNEHDNAITYANVGGIQYVGGIVGKWIVRSEEQIGGGKDKQEYITTTLGTDVNGTQYVGGLVGWLDTSACADSVVFAPIVKGSDQNKNVVKGTEYVGALFGVVVGNGYHQSATQGKYTAIVISDQKVNNITLQTNTSAKVVGGLVGYAESVGILFETDWNTSSTTFTLDDSTSFFGGVVGVLGKNSTIEAIIVTKEGDGSYLTGSEHTILNNTALGASGKPIGSFVGGIVGYVSSQAGTYWEANTTIFGNGISLVNSGQIHATGYAGGIFGALGDLSTSVAQTFENDTNSILYKVLTTGVRSGNANTTLGIAPTVDSAYFIGAKGKLVNSASLSVTDGYVGGIAGYSGAKVRFVLRNTPQTGAIATENLNVYSGGNDIFINGSYAGGIAGYLVDNLEHELKYIVVQAKFDNANAKRVGGLVGYMGSGKVENCVVTNGGNSNVNELTDTFKGSEYVGGLVGETQNAIIRNSVSTGFNLAQTTNTKGGLLGGGTNPTIEASWTFYIAQSKVAEEPGVAENKKKYKTTYPTYSTVSENTYGKYILVDNRLYNNVTFADLCKFAGITQGATAGILEFSVDVPGANKTGSLKNKQLAFYNASGSDAVTSNKESFKGFDNSNNVLTIKLDMASGTSMQICVADIEFVNVPQHGTDNDEAAHAVVESTYKKPSNSTRYHVDVTQANFDIANTKQVTYIKANVYFECNGTLTVISDGVYLDLRKVGDYDSGTLTPGSQENPYTISNQKEWNDFAYSVYTGTDYTNKYVKLLTNDIVINTGNNGSGMHEGTKGSHSFGSVQAIPSAGQNAPLTDANGNAVDRNNIGYNFAGDISHDGNVNNFHGTFDGNGHYITVNYGSGGFYRVSVFPNAAGATFRNLTIKGYIQAASQMTGANGIANSAAYDVAGFVGKPFGTLKFYNCTNEADIIGLRNVAGLVGYNAGGHSITLEACVNTGDITSLQGTYTLAGFSDKYKYFDSLEATYGTVNIGFNSGTGGIIGAYTGNITIESCRNAGTIIGGHNVGGIIGLHEGTSSTKATLTIQNCANTGNVLANSGYWVEDEGKIGGAASEGVRQYIFGYAGGLVGLTGQYSTLKMYASYNTGDVTTYSNMVGGLVGSVGAMYQPKGEKNAVKTGGRSTIAYCYNTGNVRAGGTFPKRTQNYSGGREHYGGSVVGGLVGLVGDIQISQSYNSGDVWQFGIIAYGGSWQVRAGGIVGQSQPTSGGYVLIDNVYNIGTINVRSINTVVGWGEGVFSLQADARYGAAISGYCDIPEDSNRIKVADCYSINNCVSSKIAKDISGDNEYIKFKNGTNEWYNERFDEWYKNDGVAGIGGAQVDLIETGRVYNTYDALTAAMDANSKLRMTGNNFAFDQSIQALQVNYNTVSNYTTINEQILSKDKNNITSITEQPVGNLSSIGWKNFPDSWLYVYGCLPQLSVFALDTQNGLSMRSVGYGKDVYDEYNENGLPAGSEQYPYIIKDGVDLMGTQALVDAGYSFEGKYIEVADGKNNLDGLASKRIKLATYDSPDTAATNDASNTMYKAVDENGNYKVGKSYHLLLQGAIFNKARNKDGSFVGSDYSNWAWNTYYYNGGYRDNEWTDSGSNPNKFYNYGGMRQLGIFALQNFIPMGRGSSVFKGHFSGEQANGENTTIDDVRITTGKYGTTTEYGSEYGGLFAKVQDAYIGYISIGGSSKIWSFTKENDISACGGIVGLALGDTVIDNCGIKDTAEIGSYGVSKTNEYVILDNGKIVGNITNGNFAKDTYAGGIAGMADPKQGNTYNAGITTTIRNCFISSSGRIESAKSNIGGVLGYVGGDAGASGKGNSVRIEGCNVQKAAIQAASSATESSHIGGVLGYGSEYVAAFITGCKVGNSADTTDTVTIKGEHSLGGIAGGMSNAKGGYIDSCTVGAKTSIERINQGNDNISENPKHGTAIGGLVGFTEDSTDTTSPLTTTFSGTSAFSGKINVTVGTTNPGEHGDKKPVGNVGGIVGDMGSGANFASGSDVTVDGTINITLAAANVGGVAGRTNTATFIGNFVVKPNMQTDKAENVGGFIGKNVGTVYILADTTERIVNGELNGTKITIGGTIRGTSEVGGFIGVNNSGSTLNIGSNVANAKPYRSGTLSITIAAGAEISGSGNHVGGIIGKNEGANSGQNDYATIDIVKGTIVQNGTISGKNYVGGIIGLNAGLLTTGGGEADEIIGGIALSDDQIGDIKNLSITNKGSVKGGTPQNAQSDDDGQCVGGVIGWLDAPQTLRPEHMGKGDIAGAFENSGSVEGNRFVGGSLGYVGKYVNIATKGGVNTLFVNTGNVTAHSTFVGGSIGAIVGQITGAKVGTTVNFENQGTVNGLGYVGGSIGVLAGQTQFAQFVNTSKKDFTIDACNSVGGSVGYIGMPDALKTILNTYFNDNTYSNGDITVKNVHFEASGNLTANPSDATLAAAKDDGKGGVVDDNDWGGVGGAIGVLGRNQLATWENNTYYANGNVIAQNVNNVGGIIGLINAKDITIGNLLAYNITVTGAKNVGGIVGATTGAKTVINSAYAIEGTFSATSATKGAGDNVGGIIGLAKDDTDASTSYWVKGYANSDIATYDVKDLSKLGFTTGKATTGWFFLYANDATGANGLGTINTNHQGGGEIELKYWKRIADAYTASERQTKIKDETGVEYTLATIPLKSDIVKDKDINGADTKSPQKSTLYATATAAEANSQYYMYTATSNEAVKPQVEFDDTRNGYFISVKTNDQDATGNKRQAQNVAVFYRKITKGSDLTYNGYARNAVVGMDGVGLLEQTPDETTVYDETYRNKYFYTTSTSVDGTTATTAMSDPNTYKSTIKIYFFDGKGKARIVGGIDDLEWTIKARELSATFIVATKRKYGEDSNGSEEGNKYDMFVSISNIAPNRGKQVPIKLDVSVGNDIVVTFTWNGSAFTPSKAGSGITLLSSGMKQSEAMKDSDTMFIAEEQTDDGLFTQLLNCYLVFTEAKAYTVKINTLDVVAKQRYTIKDGEDTGSFTVDPKELTLERTSGGSHAFDNTSTHGAEWKITGFVYEDGFKQLAQFNPVFHSNGQTENMYDSGGLKNNINFTNGSVVQATQTDGVNKTITITLSTVRTLGDYYIEFNAGKVGENKYRVGNYELSFVKGQNEYHIVKTTIKITSSTEKGGAYTSKVYNQKTASITVTFTASADGDPSFNGIMNFEDFLTRFFGVKDTSKFSKVEIPTSSSDIKKTVSWTFTTKADADNYVVALIEGKDHVAEEANCAHDPDKLPSYTYKIKQRPVTISVTQTGSGSYTYNTKHQGLDTVSVNQGSQGNEIGLLADDLIEIKISGSVSKPLKFKNEYSKSAGISTIDAGTYSVSFALSTATSYTQNRNYTLSVSSTSKTEWIINQYVVKVGNLNVGTDKVYDARAVVPTISIEGMSGDGKTFIYHNDTVTISYSITKVGGTSYSGNKLVNAGQYTISIGGTNSGSIKANRTGTSTDTSKNYTFGNTTQNATYTIAPRPIEIVWNIKSYVYNESKQMLQISGIKIEGNDILVAAQSVDRVKGLGNDTLTFSRSGGGINVGTNHTTNAVIASVSGKNDEVDSIVENYTIKTGGTSGEFAITPSKLKIVYSSGTANKVYDATTTIKDNTFAFTVSSTNGGANGKVDMFTITKAYDNKNVSNGYTKTVNFKYSFTSTDKNYEFDTTAQTEQSISNIGQITPAHIKVALDKLRSGKATRTFTNDERYGGNGASGNNRSQIYRAGEGFSVSGVLGNDSIVVTASYREALDSRNGTGNSFDLSKYVNDVEKNENTFIKVASGTYYKTLVFNLTGDDAANYTFNVYRGENKFGENDSTASASQNITVYDSRDKASGHQNANGAEQIKIEITVKSVRVEYSNTAQSYANDDNTYNKDWLRVTGTNKDMQGAGAEIVVTNGWMYQDGKDRPADSTDPKREYHGYTTIRGSQNSERLGAAVSKVNGMDLNYRLSNQPVLTIAYFVADGGEYKVDSLARLLIASFYYTAHQSPGDLEIVKIVSSGYQWVTVVSNDKYEKNEEIPAGFETWDAYFAKLKDDGYEVFLNVEEIKDGDVTIPANTWGYYQSTSNTDAALPTSYKLTKDISGKFTQSDIAILNTFFTVTTVGDDGHTTQNEYTWSGANSDYLKNVLSAAVDKVATINGSLFVSQKAEGAAAITGFDSTFDGNGYVIEYLNIMGYGKENVGLFDVIGANGIVKNLHLRNITINANKGNVGGIAGSIAAAEGDADVTKNVTNVSFHGKITTTGGTVGGLFGTSARAIDGAIVLGEISATNATNVGGVVGTATAVLNNVVSMMQITASDGTVGAFTSDNAHVGEKCTHMTNAVWKSGTGFVNVKDKNVGYNALMSGSNSLYANGTSASVLGTYDVIKETFADSGQNVNPRQSKRLRDMVSVYLLMYSLSANGGTYTISSSSWLVGTADGTDNNKIVIANKQNVSLLRELRFAAFVLKANVSIDIVSTFSGAFYGSVTSAVNESGVSYDYKITCNKQMFEEYATTTQAWLEVKP